MRCSLGLFVIVSGSLWGALASVLPASANTILFYRMEDGAAGSAATSLSSIGTSSLTAAAAEGGGTFSADVPAAFILDPVSGAYYENDLSVDTASAGRFDVTGSVTEVRNFTVEAFIKTSATAQFARILQKQRGGATNASWRIDPRGSSTDPLLAIRADSNDDTYGTFNQDEISGQTINTGEWQHVALTYTDGTAGSDPGVLRLYADYNLVATLTMSNNGVMQYDGGSFSFAGGPSSPNGLVGLIDEVRFSDTVLTTDQFLKATSVPEPGACTLLVMLAFGLVTCRRFRVR